MTLMCHPAVREAAVIGVPHPKWQERPLAVVVAKEGAQPTAEDLRAFLAERFAKWQLPDAFVFADELPRTSVGKLSEVKLREQYANWTWKLFVATLRAVTRVDIHVFARKIAGPHPGAALSGMKIYDYRHVFREHSPVRHFFGEAIFVAVFGKPGSPPGEYPRA